ncbi:MAG: o-succinylbenzoate synthase [Phycisphaeraceae bacterium]
MRIDAVRIYHVAMPLIQPWRTAYGEDATIESILVEMCSDGHSAWGESSPLAAPCYSAEWAGGVFAVLRRWMAPAVVGEDITSGAQLQQCLAPFKGNPFAKAALDTAWWVLDAQRQGMPLHRRLGATRQCTAVGADFGVTDTLDELLAQIDRAVAAGYPRIKLKFRPGWDLPMLRAVRGAFPDITLHVDCNGGYGLDDLALFQQLDAFNLAMIEQPLAHDDLLDHARLQAKLATPVCLDESISSPRRMRQAIELGSCRYVNIKPGRVGGLTPALAIYEQARDAGLGLWVGGMLESAVGARICAALAMLEGFDYPPDLFPSSRFYAEDVGRPVLELVQDDAGRPCVAAASAPGTGAAPVPELLERCCRQRAEVVA